MAVQQQEARNPIADRGPQTAQRMEKIKPEWDMFLARVALGLLIMSFGVVIWAINGGFSVLGLEQIAKSFNLAGGLFWSMMAAITFRVPGAPAGMPASQPLLPWLGVIAASILQIIVVYRRLNKKLIPPWLLILTIVISFYDYGTTYTGMGAVSWLAGTHYMVRLALAAPVTFLVEGVTGLLIYLARR